MSCASLLHIDPAIAHKLCSADQLLVLQLLARAVGARRVLDVGCFTDYSAVGLALALPAAPAAPSPPTNADDAPAAPEQRASKVVSLELDASVAGARALHAPLEAGALPEHLMFIFLFASDCRARCSSNCY